MGSHVRLTGSSRWPKVLETHWPLTYWNTVFLREGGREGDAGTADPVLAICINLAEEF